MKNTTENSPKIPPKFICEKCDYICCKKGDFNKHLQSIKHNTTNTTNIQQEFSYSCECGKGYNHRASLYNHKKTCTLKNNSTIETDNIDNSVDHSDKDQLILMLIKQNSELIKETSDFKSMMMKVLENGTTQNSHNTTTNTNSHNKAFNLNFFLNETCKDAMNITEFVESIKLQLSDLEKVGELGYVEGISNIIVKNLKDLDVTQRPVPDCLKSSSRYSDQYNKIIMEAMGGRGDNDFEKEEKIIKRVSKEVIVEKDP